MYAHIEEVVNVCKHSRSRKRMQTLKKLQTYAHIEQVVNVRTCVLVGMCVYVRMITTTCEQKDWKAQIHIRAYTLT